MKQRELTRTRWNQFWRGILIFALISSGFVAGFIARGHESATAQESGDSEFKILTQVDQLVRGNFVRDLPPDNTLEYAAIRGYLASLNDNYTFFNDPPVASSESDALAGRYGGIGVDVVRNEAGMIVLYPYPDSPAAQAGIVDGDILLAVNDQPLDPNERLDVVRQMTRGEITDEGSGVKVTVQQPNTTETRTYAIPFEEIMIPSIAWRVLAEAPEIGYIQIKSFTSLTPDEMRNAIADLQTKNITALVLDLRFNSGGLLQESIDVAGEFLDGGTIVIEQSRTTGETVHDDTPGGVATDLPLVVLVNGGTASAAEVVAGALKDNERAIVIGQRTFGKGSVQFIFGLEDGSSVHITASLWLTPSRTPLDGIGLLPNIEMIPDQNGRDVELGEAIRQLQQILANS
ncbi:MAG: S41 family peptidase [Chloroflexi bacterium]|nr:S41 family peptidase [Chloroflexota bacterium]